MSLITLGLGHLTIITMGLGNSVIVTQEVGEIYDRGDIEFMDITPEEIILEREEPEIETLIHKVSPRIVETKTAIKVRKEDAKTIH